MQLRSSSPHLAFSLPLSFSLPLLLPFALFLCVSALCVLLSFSLINMREPLHTLKFTLTCWMLHWKITKVRHLSQLTNKQINKRVPLQKIQLYSYQVNRSSTKKTKPNCIINTRSHLSLANVPVKALGHASSEPDLNVEWFFLCVHCSASRQSHPSSTKIVCSHTHTHIVLILNSSGSDTFISRLHTHELHVCF